MALFGFGKKKDEQKAASEKTPAAKKSAGNSKSARQRGGVKKASERQHGTVKVRRPSVVKRPSTATPKSSEAAENSVDKPSRKIRVSTKNKLLGALLVKAEKITEEQLERALAHKAAHGGLLGQVLCGLEICGNADVGAALRKQRTITTVDLTQITISPEVGALLDQDFCRRNRLVPFELIGTLLCVAMTNALDTTAKSEVKERTQMQLKIFDASNDEIQRAIKEYLSETVDAGAAAGVAPSLVEAAKAEETISEDDLVIEIPPEEEEEPAAAAPKAPVASPPSKAVDKSKEKAAAGAALDDDTSEILSEAELTAQSNDAIPSIPEVLEPVLPVIPADVLVAMPVSENYFNQIAPLEKLLPLERWLLDHRGGRQLPARALLPGAFPGV